MAKTMTKVDFMKKLTESTRGGVDLDLAKEVMDQNTGNEWSVPETGNYRAVSVGASYGVDRNGHLYINFDFIIQDPDKNIIGLKVNQFHSLVEKGKRTANMIYGILLRTLKSLGYDIEVKGSKLLKTIVDAIEELKDTKVPVVLYIKKSKGFRDQVSSVKPADDSLGDDELEEDEEEDEEEEEDDDDEYELEDEDDEVEEEEDDEDEEEVEIPSVGDTVLYSARKGTKAYECVVKNKNMSKETVSLMRVKDKRLFKNVPFSSLEGEE